MKHMQTGAWLAVCVLLMGAVAGPKVGAQGLPSLADVQARRRGVGAVYPFVGNTNIDLYWSGPASKYELWRDGKNLGVIAPDQWGKYFYRDLDVIKGGSYTYTICYGESWNHECSPYPILATAGKIHGWLVRDLGWYAGEYVFESSVFVVMGAVLDIHADANLSGSGGLTDMDAMNTGFFNQSSGSIRMDGVTVERVGLNLHSGSRLRASTLSRTTAQLTGMADLVQTSVLTSTVFLYGSTVDPALETLVADTDWQNSSLRVSDYAHAEVVHNRFVSSRVGVGGKQGVAAIRDTTFLGQRDNTSYIAIDSPGGVLNVQHNLLIGEEGYSTGISIENAREVLVEETTIRGEAGIKTGWALPITTSLLIRSNILKISRGGYGVDLNSAGSVIIEGNTFPAGHHGVRLHNIQGANVALRQNCFAGSAGSQVGLLAENSSGTVQAAENWWGDISGPHHTSNPGGTGASVVLNNSTLGLTLKPWLKQGNCALEDFAAVGMEVVQVVQKMNNIVPLIPGKPALLRAYAGSFNSSVGSLPAAVRFYRGADLIRQEMHTIPALPFNSLDELRSDLGNGLALPLAPELLTGALRIEVELDPSHTLSEATYANNLISATLFIESRPPFKVAYLPVENGDELFAPNDEFYPQMSEWIKTVFPAPDVQYTVLPPVTLPDNWGRLRESDLPIIVGSAYGIAVSKNMLEKDIQQLILVVDDPVGETMIHNQYPIMSCRPSLLCKQRLGSALGLWGYPDYRIKEYGYDFSRGEVVPGNTLDFMSGLEPNWISPYNYVKLFINAWKGHFLRTAGAAQDYLLVSGQVNQAGAAAFQPFLELQADQPPLDLPAGSAYCLETHGAADALLASQCFDLSFVDPISGTALSQVPFLAALPLNGAETRVALRQGAVELGSAARSAHRPAVQLTMPNSGSLGEHVTVGWQGQDVDGDDLTYAILYSPDNGASWAPVAVGISGTNSLALDTTGWSGTAAGRLRVMVSDGFLSASDDTDGALNVAQKAPWVSILHPADGLTISDTQKVYLSGAAYDLEDGALSGAALTWSSSLDGFLGTGSPLGEVSLSPGVHQVRLAAQDSRGRSAQQAITITVSAAQSWPRVYLPLAQQR